MYEVFGLTEEEGRAIDRELCRIVTPLLGCDPDDISDETIADRIRSGFGILDTGIPDPTERQDIPPEQNLFEIREDGDIESLMSRLAD